MIVYCARLTWHVALAVTWRRLSGNWPSSTQIRLLDEPVRGASASVLARLLGLTGVAVREETFLAGHLRTSAGRAVRPEARRAAFILGEKAATEVLKASPLLKAINARWGRDTLKLAIAKRMWRPAEHLTLRLLVADALASGSVGPTTVMIEWPSELPGVLVGFLPTVTPVVLAGKRRRGWRTGRLSPVLWAMRLAVRQWLAKPLPPLSPDDQSTGLLILQEDDLSFDRSVRSQPHWAAKDSPLPFRTVILRLNSLTTVGITDEELRSARMEIVDARRPFGARQATPITSPLRADAMNACTLSVFATSSSTSFAAAEVLRLLLTADSLARLCTARRIRAFMTCENYTVEADAMQLLAGPMGIRTVSYQYSVLPYPSLLMITTADTLVTFAPMFHQRFAYPGFKPPRFVDGGYVFSSNFPRVKKRATERRARLKAAGATFVVGVFDESVQQDKYGLIDIKDYEKDLVQLLEWLDRDPSLGIVMKTQFMSHQKLLSTKMTDAIAAASATGRFEMPMAGHHRNTILPADVAASADITIGHAIGGTASLEAALVGCRSLILNPFNIATDADETYAKADVIYTSLQAACDAIDAHRRGDEAYAALGDWRPILSEFDPFLDDRSSDRLRAVVETAVCA